MKATVLIDNNSFENLLGEWGLSIYIEYKDKKILLDTGKSNLFFENAEKLDLSLKDVDYAVISHAHYDHSNGMAKFFEENKKAKCFMQENSKENCYKKVLFYKKYIGLPKNILKNYSDRIELVKSKTICEGVHIVSHSTENLSLIGKKEKMLQKVDGGWKDDDFSHEQSLVFETEKGLVIFNSCSHGGVINIFNEVKKSFPDKKIFGIIGGFHMYNKSDEEVKNLAEKINETGIDFVCTGHCTGSKAYEILKAELKEKIKQLYVSLEMNF